MKKVALATFMFFAFLSGSLNAQGINFKHISIEQAMELAQKEGKLIFIDFHTVWCAPCRGMEKNVFPNKKVGEYFNKTFINVEFDAEKEGKELAKKYGVNAYPTMVFINGDGKLVYKRTGARDANQLIAMGKEASAAVMSEYSLLNLREMYPEKKNDPEFLRMYIDKLIANRENPAEVIEQWLNVQTDIKEDDVDMMEFLFDHRKHLIVDGKAEQIFKDNYDEFWDICTPKEEAIMEKMLAIMANNTKTLAFSERNPQLMRAFINNWKRLEDYQYGVLTEYEMEYCILNDDIKGFKQLANAYVDSIMSAKTLKQIRAEDAEYFEYFKKNEYTRTMAGANKYYRYEKGREATSQKAAIEKTTKYYLRFCDSKKDYKKLESWVEYAAELVPQDIDNYNLHAEVLYKKGDTKKAIAYKQAVLEQLSEKNLKRDAILRDIELMEKGEAL